MKNKRITEEDIGITLIALVVTIIVLLILAGITIMLLFGDNGIIKQATEAAGATENAELNTEDSILRLSEQMEDLIKKGYISDDTKGEWREKTKADGSKVITNNSGIELKMGDYINYDCTPLVDEELTVLTKDETGYQKKQTINPKEYNKAKSESYKRSDGRWIVLGINENRQLEIISENAISILQEGDSSYGKDFYLQGNVGYENGIDMLNKVCAAYGKGAGAAGARNLTMEDINKVTGYNPNNEGVKDYERKTSGNPYGKNTIAEYGTTITAYWDSTKNYYPFLSNSNGQNMSMNTSHEKYVWYDEEGKLQSVDRPAYIPTNTKIGTTKITGYEYYPTTLTGVDDDTASTGIGKDSLEYSTLFGSRGIDVWVATQYSSIFKGFRDDFRYGLFYLSMGVYRGPLCNSEGVLAVGDKGIRPVVVLKANATLKDTGETVTSGSIINKVYDLECIGADGEKEVAIDTVTISETAIKLSVGGESHKLSATITPDTANKEMIWTSENTAIATVDEEGNVSPGTEGGETKIIGRPKKNPGKKVECVVTVKGPETFSEIYEETKLYTDSDGNTAMIPKGFAVGTSNNINKVNTGLVIQDKDNNQFVWIPVGNVKNTNGETVNISLARYSFKYSDEGETIQTPDKYTETIKADSYFTESSTSNTGTEAKDGGNTTAKDLKAFLDSVEANHGYYMARYEASNDGLNNAKSIAGVDAWTDLTQIYAADRAGNMYNDDDTTVGVKSDLINSYAWDTAIKYIQEMGKNPTYSNLGRKDVGNKNTSKVKTGENEDVACNINDMAANVGEWSTETSSGTSSNTGKCVLRGGIYYAYYTHSRTNNYANKTGAGFGFRTVLYIKPDGS